MKALTIQITIPQAEASDKTGSTTQNTSLESLNLEACFAHVGHFLLDWDGCVALGDVPLEPALAFIRKWPDRVAIVSNNTTRLPQDIAAILAKSGAVVPASRIILAGTEAIARAAEIGAKRVMIVGDQRLKAYARNMGLGLVNEDAELVVMLRDTRFSYAKLCRAVNSVAGGARLIIGNPDLSHPGPRGRVVPETGALTTALMACLDGIEVNSEIIGKPSWRLFERACKALGAKRERALMIGDNPKTDMAGAAAYGLKGLLIGPAVGIDFTDILALPAL